MGSPNRSCGLWPGTGATGLSWDSPSCAGTSILVVWSLSYGPVAAFLVRKSLARSGVAISSGHGAARLVRVCLHDAGLAMAPMNWSVGC